MSSRTAAGVVYATFWASGFVGAELGTRAAPALDLLMWRYLVAGPLLVLACLAVGARASRRVLGQQVLLGVLVQLGYLGALVLAVGNGVPAGTAALVAALQPMVVAVAAGPLLGERVGRLGWAGLAVGLLGVGLVVAGDLTAGTAGWWLLGPVVAMLSLSAGTLLGRRWEPPSSLLLSITVQACVATVGFAALNLAVGAPTLPRTGDFWIAVAWVVILSTFGGYGSYLFVLRQQGATRASTWLYLSPPITVVWAWLMFGDALTVAGVAGLAVTAVGVALVLRGGDAPPRPAHHPSSAWAPEGMPAKKSPGPSVKDPELYERLRDEGNSKQKSARIANAAANTSRKKVGEKGGSSPSYDEWTVEDLRKRAAEIGIEGRSKMNKSELVDALRDS